METYETQLIEKQKKQEKEALKLTDKRKAILKGLKFKRAELSKIDFSSLNFVSSLPRGVPPTNVGECQGK